MVCKYSADIVFILLYWVHNRIPQWKKRKHTINNTLDKFPLGKKQFIHKQIKNNGTQLQLKISNVL